MLVICNHRMTCVLGIFLEIWFIVVQHKGGKLVTAEITAKFMQGGLTLSRWSLASII